MTDLEIGYSARNGDEWDRLFVALQAFRCIDVEAHHFDPALQIQRGLAELGLKGRKVPDLVIATVADCLLAVLHYDADFDHIATFTGQPTEWVVRRGTVRLRNRWPAAGSDAGGQRRVRNAVAFRAAATVHPTVVGRTRPSPPDRRSTASISSNVHHRISCSRSARN